MCVLSRFSHVQLFATLRTVAHEAPLSRDSPGKNTGVGWHALCQGIFLPTDQTAPKSPALQVGSSPLVPAGKPRLALLISNSKQSSDILLLLQSPYL